MQQKHNILFAKLLGKFKSHYLCSKITGVIIRCRAKPRLARLFALQGAILVGLSDQKGRLLLEEGHITADVMNIFIVSAQIPTLSESPGAEIAFIGPLCSVFTEMVTEVAALFELSVATLIFTPKVKCGLSGLFVRYSNYIMPLIGNPFKVLDESRPN